MSETHGRYRWAAWGDLNAFFGLALDNLTDLILLWGILAAAGFPSVLYFTKIVPGTALGVLAGDLIYSWLAFRLAKRTGSQTVTAMPLGLDTPSTIGVALAVLIPAFVAAQGRGLSVEAAGDVAWKVGMATMVFMGIIKTVFSFCGRRIQALIPQAGLLGSLAAVGVTLLGFIPIIHIFGTPAVGLPALGLVIYTLVAGKRLPLGIPGAFAAVAVGSIIYYARGLFPWAGPAMELPALALQASVPLPTLGFLEQLGPSLAYLPFALPFGLLTIVGGINVTESARCAGDDFNTRSILLTEALTTLVAGVFGGVVQSTPYIGHPAYKSMGARAGYTLATGLFVGLGAFFGMISWVVALIPAAAVAPVLFFIGMEVNNQAFSVCPVRHYAALFMALPPAIGELVRILLSSLLADPAFQGISPALPGTLASLEAATVLGHGFIITSMLWAAATVFVIDGKLRRCALTLVVMAALTFFGFMHSTSPAGDIYLPWTLAKPQVAYSLTVCYLALALVAGLVKERR